MCNMEDRDDVLPGTDLDRLITFELDSDEILRIAAGGVRWRSAASPTINRVGAMWLCRRTACWGRRRFAERRAGARAARRFEGGSKSTICDHRSIPATPTKSLHLPRVSDTTNSSVLSVSRNTPTGAQPRSDVALEGIELSGIVCFSNVPVSVFGRHNWGRICPGGWLSLDLRISNRPNWLPVVAGGSQASGSALPGL